MVVPQKRTQRMVFVRENPYLKWMITRGLAKYSGTIHFTPSISPHPSIHPSIIHGFSTPSLQGAVLRETCEGAQMPRPGPRPLTVHGGCHQVAVCKVGGDGPGISPVEGDVKWQNGSSMVKKCQKQVKLLWYWDDYSQYMMGK